MSEAARQFVKRFHTHPLVKGNVRALLDQIADLVEEGQTATGQIATQELAVLTRQDQKTVRRGRRLLRGIVKVHGGGKGKPARYELLGMAGARPIADGELPLRADLRPVTRAKAPATADDDAQPDLFGQTPTGESPVPVENALRGTGDSPVLVAGVVTRYGRLARAVVTQMRKWGRRWASTGETPVLVAGGTGETPVLSSKGTGETPVPAPPLDVDDTDSATTTYVRSKKDPDLVANLVVVADAHARDPADAFLDWFDATYPTVHHGAVCLTKRARDRPLVGQLLQRPLTDGAHLEAMTRYLWTVTTDGVEGSNAWWIAERVTVRDVFVLHRKADFLDLEVRRAAREAAAAGDVWTQVLAQLRHKVNALAFQTWFADTALEHDGGAVIQIAAPANHLTWLLNDARPVVDEAVQEVRPGTRVDFVPARRGVAASG